MRLPATIVAAAALAYPLATVLGGAPSFPSRAECVDPAHGGGSVEAVFGRFDRRRDAEAVLKRAVAVGFGDTRIESDGCGRLKVSLDGIPNLDVGRDLLDEARSVGLTARLERAGS